MKSEEFNICMSTQKVWISTCPH